MGALTIARYTLRKASRDKIFYLIPLITIVALALIQNLRFFEVGVRVKVLTDFGLAAVGLFGFLIALMVTLSLVPFERETRSLYFLLSKPVGRGHFVAGKFLGVAFLLFINLVIVGGELVGLVRIYSGSWDVNLVKGLYLLFLKLVLFSSFVVLLSTFLSMVLIVFASVLVYVVTHAISLAETSLTMGTPKFFQVTIHYLLAALPDLTHFDASFVVVHGHAIPGSYVVLVTLYALAYVAFFLLTATWILERTDL
jgi:ABC-type transport system involved in multi-copper enzyme maturation permease subunit